MDYVQQRKQFGRQLGEFQHTQFKLADMQTQLHASRLMVRHAARALDAKAPTATADAAMAKRFATDACYDITNDALQLLGGYGYLRDYPVERCDGFAPLNQGVLDQHDANPRYMRDLRVHSILEGTNEVMRMIVHREMLKQRSA